MKLDLEKHWYQPSATWLTRMLQPLSWVFAALVSTRQFCYRQGIKKSQRFPVPVIVIGNITIGGTGKTPLVIWLAKFLKQRGFHPGIVSRGVGGKQSIIPRIVTTTDNAREVGDEALLLARRSECPVVVGVKRVAAVKTLLEKFHCDIVISDDGLQHYALARDIEIAIIDNERQLGNENLLPAGPLRENKKRLTQVDFVITHGDNSQDFCMHLKGDEVHSLDGKKIKPLAEFTNQAVHAVTAIGNPQRFLNVLRAQGLTVIPHIFPDHFHFAKTHFDFSDHLPILMTEKDAVKCSQFYDDRFWFLPVAAEVSETFQKKLIEKLERRV